MSSLRSVFVSTAFAAALLLGATGCRTAGMGNTLRPSVLSPMGPDATAAELLADHNRNAELVESLEAHPDVKVDSRLHMGASGRLAVERPRNFKLELAVGLSDVANIGSNDKEFWFWVKGSDEKAIFYCDYDENGESPLAGNLQPDWIMEALGLSVVGTEEAERTMVRPGLPGTLVLTRAHTTARGQRVFKEIVLSESTRRIREHRVYAEDHHTLLAQATITEYQDVVISAEGEGPGPNTTKVFLPKTLKLDWPQQKLSLQIWLSSVVVNARFDAARRALIFVEPKIRGFDRRNLAEYAASPRSSAAGPSGVRESMPAPPPRVKLSEPTTLGPEGSRKDEFRGGSRLTTRESTTPSGVARIVGPAIPTVAEPVPVTADGSSGWRNTVER